MRTAPKLKEMIALLSPLLFSFVWLGWVGFRWDSRIKGFFYFVY